MRDQSLRAAVAAALVIVIMVACAPGGGAPSAASMTADSTAIEQVRTTYQDAYNRKDAAAVAGLYADDAVEIEGNGMVLKGRAALQDMFTKDTANWGKLTITPFGGAHIAGEVAFGTGTASVEVKQGAKTMLIPGSYLIVMHKAAGAWKIAALAAVNDSTAIAAMMAPPAKPPKGK